MKFISYCFKALSPAVNPFLVIIGLSFSIVSCQWGDEIVSIVQPNPDDFAALYTDTSTVRLSTLKPDSIMTGSIDRVFVGRFTDPYFGKMQSSAFFQTELRAALTLADKAEYDSLILSLKYDGYYYGDTTKAINLSVHALQEDITLSSAFYNDDSTPYDAEPLGRVRFLPNPNTPQKVVRIKLSNALGKKVFDLAKANMLTSNSDWINILKGVAVIPGASDNSAVVGFRGFANDSTSIQLHYHTPEIEGITKDSTIFRINALYDQITGDHSQTVLSKLPKTSRLSLLASESNELAFIQAGTGITARVDFPTVRQLKYVKYSFANRAYLRIIPFQQSVTEQFKVPRTIYAYYADKNNQYYSGSNGFPQPLLDLNGQQASATLVNDLVNNKQFYLLDVSQYVSEILRSESEESAGLLLRSAPFSNSDTRFPDLNSNFIKGFHRLVIGSQNNPTERGVKLELYYTTVKPE